MVRFAVGFLVKSKASPAVTVQTPHPRGLIDSAGLSLVKERLTREPYKTFWETFSKNNLILKDKVDSALNTDIYEIAYLASGLAAMGLINNNEEWIKSSEFYFQMLLNDEEIFLDPVSRGLTRATLLQRAGMIYDLLANNWPPKKKQEIAERIFPVLTSVNANMGYSANYNLASNWMGVRWGSVLYTSLILDDFSGQERSHLLPFLWDSQKRLIDHLEANLYSNGWNGESIGYHAYNWSFAGPALAALDQQLETEENLIELLIPRALNSLHAFSTATISIESSGYVGMKPDLSDDNLNSGLISILPFGFRLYPENQHPYLKWMHDYLFNAEKYRDFRGYLLYSLLYYPEKLEKLNPAKAGWLNYHDPEQGLVMFRNRFQDENDILLTYSATAKRVKGHQGPDTNTWRLIGLGVPWVIGAGRTGEIAGQTNLFPKKPVPGDQGNKNTGILEDFAFSDSGSGYAIGTGSNMGVENHRRFLKVDYEHQDLADAIIVISEHSSNGKIWRINTPEFNEVQLEQTGYSLVAPNGSSLKVTVLGQASVPPVSVSKIRYGGSTEQNNPGINYQGQSYEYSKALDLETNGNLLVVITLTPPGKIHPEFRLSNHKIISSDQQFQLDLPTTYR